MLQQFLASDLFAPMLVFCRIGSAMMLLPGFGEVYVALRVRLVISLAITAIVTPAVILQLPPLPAGPLGLFVLVGGEIMIGLYLGAYARFLVSALHTAGVIVSFQSSLANAQLFDPNTAQQGSLIGTYLSVIGVFLIFFANLHHVMLLALVDSYTLFLPGAPIPTGDFAEMAAKVLVQSFALALKIAAPLIVVGMVFYLGLGLLARLMPQVQVFFIAIPLQIALGFFVLALTLTAGMTIFLGHFESHWVSFMGGG